MTDQTVPPNASNTSMSDCTIEREPFGYADEPLPDCTTKSAGALSADGAVSNHTHVEHEIFAEKSDDACE